MLHNLWPLHRLLKRRGYNLSVESNGTTRFLKVYQICISPKDQVTLIQLFVKEMGMN